MSEKTDSNKNILQFIKFALFSASAGLIQIGSFTLLNEVLMEADFMQRLIRSNETFGNIMTNEYGPCYLIALVLSIIWNFTFNRKFTFKSATNIPIAMLKVFGFYLIFTPVSTALGVYFTNKFFDIAAIEYIVLGITMLCNMITEYLFCKFVVYRNNEYSAVQNSTTEEETE